MTAHGWRVYSVSIYRGRSQDHVVGDLESFSFALSDEDDSPDPATSLSCIQSCFLLSALFSYFARTSSIWMRWRRQARSSSFKVVGT